MGSLKKSDKWVPVIVPLADTQETQSYFLGLEFTPSNDGAKWYKYLCRNSTGKIIWAVKPGIALNLKGGPEFFEMFKNSSNIENLVAIEIPVDADKRWKAKGKPRGK